MLHSAARCGSVPCDEGGGGCRCHPGVGLAVGDAEGSRHLLRRQSAPNLDHYTRQKSLCARDRLLEKVGATPFKNQGGWNLETLDFQAAFSVRFRRKTFSAQLRRPRTVEDLIHGCQ